MTPPGHAALDTAIATHPTERFTLRNGILVIRQMRRSSAEWGAKPVGDLQSGPAPWGTRAANNPTEMDGSHHRYRLPRRNTYAAVIARHISAATSCVRSAAHIVASACLSVWPGTRGKWRDRHQAAHGLFVLYEAPDRARLTVA